jgi:hypothetical protein
VPGRQTHRGPHDRKAEALNRRGYPLKAPAPAHCKATPAPSADGGLRHRSRQRPNRARRSHHPIGRGRHYRRIGSRIALLVGSFQPLIHMIARGRANSMNTPLVAGFNAKVAGLERAPGAGSVIRP